MNPANTPDLAHTFIWGGGRVSGVVCSEGQGEHPGSSVRSEEGELRAQRTPIWVCPADTPSVGSPLSIHTGSLSDRQDLSPPTQL